MINKFQTFTTTDTDTRKPVILQEQKTDYKTWTLNKAIMSRDMYIDLPDNNLPHISQTN